MANGQIRYTIDFDVNQQKLNELKAQLQAIKNLNISQLMNVSGLGVDDAKRLFLEIRKEASNVQIALNKAFNPKLNSINIKTFEQSLKSSKTSIQKIGKTFAAAGVAGQAAFNKLNSQVLGVNVRMRESNTLLDKMATTLGNSIKWNIASSAINGVSRGIQQAWGFTKSLDSSLNDIRIVTGKSADEMARFSVQANQAAQNLGKNTTDYTNAALIYAQQGLSDKQIEARTAITLKTANVTGQDTKDVSEELTAVWNGYKVNAEQAQLYVDRLAAVAATTASNLEELSTAMSKVASAANAMGVSEEQLAAQLSTIISATRQAPQSVGTALRTVYARISDIKAGIDQDGVTLGNYSGKMAALGISVLDVNGRLRDMGEVMEQIGEKWQDMTREQQINLAQTMAGQRQYNNLLALFDNFDKYSSSLQTASKAQGTLNKQQDIYMDRTTAKLNQLKAATESIYMSLTDTDSINSVIQALTALATGAKNFVDAIGGGQGVLLNLGTIGLNVFNTQLTNGINNFIQRIYEAKVQTQELFNKANYARERSVDPNVGIEAQGLYKQRAATIQSFATLRMSPQNFEYFQKLNDETLQAIGNFNKAKNAYELLNNELKNTRQIQPQKQFEKLRKQLDLTSQETRNVQVQFQNFRSQLPKKISDQAELQQYKDNFNNIFKNINFDNLKIGESLQKQIQTAKTSIDNLKFGDGVSQSFNYQMAIITGSLDAHLKELQNAMNNASPEKLEKLRQQYRLTEQQIKKCTQETQEFKKSLQMQNAIQNIMAIVSALTSIYTMSNNIKRSFDIVDNKELTNIEKFEQLLSSIGITLAVVIPLAQRLLPLLSGVFGKIGLGGIATFLTGGGILPILAVAGGLTVIATSLGLLTKNAEKSRKALQENNKQLEENINKSKETIKEIEQNQKLYDSLLKLNKEIEESGLSRTELKNKIQDLCSQYGLEEDQVQRLINKYQDLDQAVRDEKLKDITKEENASKDRVKNAEQRLNNNFKKGQNGTINLNIKGPRNNESSSSLTGRYQNSHQYLDIDKVLATSLGVDTTYFSNFENFVNNIKKATSNIPTGKAFIQYYQQQEKTIAELENQYTEAELKQHRLYNSIKEFLQENKVQVQELIEAYKEQDNIQVAKQVLSKQFGEIKSLPQFLKKRAKILAGKDQNAIGAFNEAIGYYGNQFGQANKIAQWQDKVKSQFSEQDSNKFIQGLQQFTKQQQDALMSMDVTKFNSIDDLLNYINNYISKINNFDEIDYSKLDLDAIIDYASDIYVKYQEIEDKIKSGKNLSKKEFGELIPELQGYFTQLANGTYKLTGDAQEFYKIVNQYKMQDYYQALEVSQAKINFAENVKAGTSNIDYDYDTLSQSAWNIPGYEQWYNQGNGNENIKNIAEERLNLQLQVLDAIAAEGSQLDQNVEIWKQHFQAETLSKEQINSIADAVADLGDLSGEKLDELRQDQQKLYEQIYDAMFPTDADIDTQVLNSLSDTIQQIATSTDELSNSLSTNQRAAEDVAESILRFDNAIEDVVKNYDDWIKALNNGSIQEQAEIIDGLRDAYADLLDLDGSSLSNQFLTSTDNLNLMKAAIDGDIAAYDQLLLKAGQDIIAHLQLSPQDYAQFQTDLANIQSLMDKLNFQNLEIGASLNDDDFLAGLQHMVNAAGMTAQQATDYLASMGVDAEVVEQKSQGTETKTQTGWESTLVPNTETGEVPVVSGIGGETTITPMPITFTTYSSQYTPTTEEAIDTKENTAFSLKVTSAKKSSGGKFKFSQAKNGGGSKGAARRAGKGGGGGGGGGGGKAYKSKDKKDPNKDRDHRYHDINEQLDKSDKLLTSISKKQSRLSGQAFIDNLNQQIKLLEKQNELTEQKIKLQKEDLSERKEQLSKLGVQFDGEDISNYIAMVSARQAELNKLTAEYNALVDKANTEQSDNYDAELEAKNKQIELSKKALDEEKKLMDEYEKLQDEIWENQQKIADRQQQIIEKQIQKFHYSIEIHLNLSNAEKEWNEFKTKYLGKTVVDILARTDYSEGMQDINLAGLNYQTGVDKINKLNEHLREIQDEIDVMQSGQESQVYGDNLTRAYEDLKKYNDELTSSLKDLQDQIDNVRQAFEKIMSYIEDKFQQYRDDLDLIGQSIEHNMNLLKLLYGDDQYEAMSKYYEKLKQNQLQSVANNRHQAELWHEEWQKAVARGDEEGAAQMKERWKKSLRTLQSSIEETAQTIKSEYENAIDQIFDKLEKKMTNGKGLDYLNTEWDLLNKQDDMWLDDVNSAFGLQDLEYTFNIAINDTADLKNQKALAKLRDQELKDLKAKDKLTQYDLDRAKKRLEIEQARIALEEAQQAKSTMRLRRDSQGNYRYEYVADQNQIAEAQQNLIKAENDLYNLDKNQNKTITEDFLSTYSEAQNKVKDILSDTTVPYEERMQQAQEILQQYSPILNGLWQQMTDSQKNLIHSAFDAMGIDLQNLSDTEVDVLMGQMVPTWNNGVKEMADAMINEGGLLPACQQAFTELDGVTKNYQLSLDELSQVGGEDLDAIKEGATEIADQIEEELIPDDEEVIGQLDQMAENADKAYDSFITLSGALEPAVLQAHNLADEIYDAWQNAEKLKATIEDTDVDVPDIQRNYSNNTSGMKPTESVTPVYDNGGSGGSGGGGSGYVNPPGGGGLPEQKKPKSYTIPAYFYDWSKQKTTTGFSYKTILEDPTKAVKKLLYQKGELIQDTNDEFGGIKKSQYYIWKSPDTGQYIASYWDPRKKGSWAAIFDTGGYTGEWGDQSGKLAMLHEKELVLNKSDTSNILNSVSILRDILHNVGSNIFEKLSNLTSNKNISNLKTSEKQLEQNVHIEANFPNVNSKRQIEEAFNDLVNLAAQRAMRRK